MKILSNAIVEVCDALSVLHHHNLIHRPKPANLIQGPDGSLVMDLGIVNPPMMRQPMRPMPRERLDTWPRKCSPMPPLMGEQTCMLWALSYQALSGVAPFDGPTPMAILYKQAHVEPQPIRRLNSEISKPMGDLVHRLLRKPPGERFQSASELAEVAQNLSHARQGTSSILPISVLIMCVVGGGLWWLSDRTNDVQIPDAGTFTQVVVQDARVPEPVIDATPIVDAAPVRVKIRLASQPSGVTSTKGELLGTTPFTLERPLNSAAVKVSFRKSGFQRRTRTIRFTEAQTVRVNLEPGSIG